MRVTNRTLNDSEMIYVPLDSQASQWLIIEIHEIHRLKVEIHVQNIEIQNTGHEIHGNTAKANGYLSK